MSRVFSTKTKNVTMMERGDCYEVERILDKSVSKHGRILYLVKWKNFNETANTWESRDHLYCDHLIEEYENENRSLIEGADSSADVTSSDFENSPHKIYSHSSAPSDSRSRTEKCENLAGRRERGNSVERSDGECSEGETANAARVGKRENGGRDFSFVKSEHSEMKRSRKKAGDKFNRRVKRIIGAANGGDCIKFLVEWTDGPEYEVVSNSVARQRFPRTLLDFYEKRICWC